RLRTAPALEAARLLAGRLGWRTPGWCTVDAVYADLDRRMAAALAAPGVRGVYAYEDGALASFREARRRGLRTFYDQPIAHWRTLHHISAEEAEREPAWAATLTALDDGPAKLERKDEELRLADRVFAASSYTARTLEGEIDPAKVTVIPYGSGADDGEAFSGPRSYTAPGTPLRVLYVGSLSQRKGISYLFDALAQAGLGSGCEATVVGRKVTERPCPALDAALARPGIRWIPSLPHATVLAEMERHDVLVFPSLFEGFGLVIPEAMSRGLAVIATPHTAAPDLIEDGRDGFVVPIRSAGAIAERLDALRADRERLRAVGEAARVRAAALRWETYRARLAAAVSEDLR
ncbi:MAG TPA: glycosyltransferase family 4 protein, partial [Candidatus Methylacidiphilales bacterium]